MLTMMIEACWLLGTYVTTEKQRANKSTLDGATHFYPAFDIASVFYNCKQF